MPAPCFGRHWLQLLLQGALRAPARPDSGGGSPAAQPPAAQPFRLRPSALPQGPLQQHARRAQVYSAAFDLATHQRLLEDDARAVADLAQFVENCKKPLFFVGDGASLCYNKYGSVPGVLETPPALRGGRAAAVALVAKQMAEAGQAVLPEALLPDYHRLSQAERERAERLAAEAAAKA